MLTYMQKPLEVQEKWYLVNAEGKTLGRLAARVAGMLAPSFAVICPGPV